VHWGATRPAELYGSTPNMEGSTIALPAFPDPIVPPPGRRKIRIDRERTDQVTGFQPQEYSAITGLPLDLRDAKIILSFRKPLRNLKVLFREAVPMRMARN